MDFKLDGSVFWRVRGLGGVEGVFGLDHTQPLASLERLLICLLDVNGSESLTMYPRTIG